MRNTINLLAFNAKPQTFWEKFYNWALTIGRYIIIGVEIIVLIAFFYKFKLDNDLANVKAKIDSDVTIFKKEATTEKQIQTYQKRVVDQKFVFDNQVKYAPVVAHTLSLLPSNIVITGMTFDAKRTLSIAAEMSGTSQQQLSEIQDIANAFKSDSDYNTVSLSNIDSNVVDNATDFNLNANLNIGQ